MIYQVITVCGDSFGVKTKWPAYWLLCMTTWTLIYI